MNVSDTMFHVDGKVHAKQHPPKVVTVNLGACSCPQLVQLRWWYIGKWRTEIRQIRSMYCYLLSSLAGIKRHCLTSGICANNLLKVIMQQWNYHRSSWQRT